MTGRWCNKLPDYELVVESSKRRVVMLGALEREYGRIALKDAVALRKWMALWCEDVDGAIPDTRMKAQERYDGPKGESVLIIAFKSYQARLYGFIRSVEGKETFLVTSADAKKKDDNANPRVLKRAREEAFLVLGVLGIR